MRQSVLIPLVGVLASLVAFFAMGYAIGGWLYDLAKERP